MPQPLAMSIPATAQHATRAGGACVSEGHAQRTRSSTIDKKVRNFYSVSISGYHPGSVAGAGATEAGANPISQLAFTLANGFTGACPGPRTGMEYYLSRGMDITPARRPGSTFAPNLSFFFSNGMDPEYAVMGRVALPKRDHSSHFRCGQRFGEPIGGKSIAQLLVAGPDGALVHERQRNVGDVVGIHFRRQVGSPYPMLASDHVFGYELHLCQCPPLQGLYLGERLPRALGHLRPQAHKFIRDLCGGDEREGRRCFVERLGDETILAQHRAEKDVGVHYQPHGRKRFLFLRHQLLLASLAKASMLFCVALDPLRISRCRR